MVPPGLLRGALDRTTEPANSYSEQTPDTSHGVDTGSDAGTLLVRPVDRD